MKAFPTRPESSDFPLGKRLEIGSDYLERRIIMSMVINTNIASITAQRHLSESQGDLQTSMERLSSGKRINSAMDDAAGLQIRDRMDSQISGLSQAVRNSNDAISLAQTAEGALEETTEILQRMRELTIQASNATYTSDDRNSLQAEVSDLLDEINNIANYTRFNDQTLMNADGFNGNFQVGHKDGEVINLTIGDMSTTKIGKVTGSGTNGSVSGTTQGIQVSAPADAISAGTLNATSAPTSGLAVTNGVDAVTTAVPQAKWSDSFSIASAASGTAITFATSEGTASFTFSSAPSDNTAAATAAAAGMTLAGYTFTAAGDTVTVERADDSAFAEEIAATVSGGGTVTNTAHTAGTASVPVSPGVAWSASQTFETGASKGDQVTFTLSNGEKFEYKAATDMGTANALAADVALQLMTAGMGGKYTASAVADTVTLHSLTTGVDASTVTVAATARPADGAVGEKETLAISAAPTAGDKMTINVNGDDFTHTFSTGATTVSAATAEVVAAWNGTTAGFTTGYTASAATDGTITLTADIKGLSGSFDASASYEKVVAVDGSNKLADVNIGGTGASISASLKSIDAAIKQVGAERGNLGAFQNRLEHTISNVQSMVENTSAARSRIEDADFATESANLAKNQVLQQAGTAMLAQANASTQNVMSLLR